MADWRIHWDETDSCKNKWNEKVELMVFYYGWELKRENEKYIFQRIHKRFGD